MKRIILGTLLCFFCCSITFAQINNYVINTWAIQPQLQGKGIAREPTTLLKYIVVRDFNRAQNTELTHYRTIYKRIRINTQTAADSLTQLLIVLEPYERARTIDARVINPDGTVVPVSAQRLFAKGSIECIRLSPLALKAGAELEYDLTINEMGGYAGYEYMQGSSSCEQATFMLVLPPDMLFRTRGSNGFPDVADSISNGVHYYHATSYHLPALPPGDLYFQNSWLQRIEFAPRENDWQQPSKEQFLKYVNIERADYKKLEKELGKWDFLKQRMPIPTLIYRIEQQIKSQYTLVDDNPNAMELSDLTTILRTKTCNETGMVKLMASVYYLLGVHSQILFCSGKESLPIDSSMVNTLLAQNVLIYFPELRQALAPAVMQTRFPFFPAAWAGTMAIRCRDTVIDKNTEVLADLIRTPETIYTDNNISLDANIDINTQGVIDVQLKQTVGGYPGTTIKNVVNSTSAADREELYNSLLPTGPIRVSGLTHHISNESWESNVNTTPFILESSFQTDSIHVGILINGLVQQYVAMPPAAVPVEMAYPFYQESRINITVPAGYKMTNVNDYILNLGDNALGYKITCKQVENKVSIYAVKWFRKTDFTGDEKVTFEKILQADNKLKTRKIILER